jgi:uracil-DNA glycosylase family 4
MSNVQHEKYEKPFYLLDAPGMPLPGPDFVSQAVNLGDPKPKLAFSVDRRKELVECGDILNDLYYAALYESDFNLNVKFKGRSSHATFLRGHLWGYQVTGPYRAHVMVIGKFPGKEELAARRNFVGPSSQLLTQELEGLGVSMEHWAKWYVTNVVRHVSLNPTSTRLSASWINNCLPLLEEELRLVRPRYVLVLGAEATKVVMKGDVVPDELNPEVMIKRIPLHRRGDPERYFTTQVMSCVHPAAVVRQADMLPQLRKTLQRFVGIISGAPSPIQREVDYRVVYGESELASIVDSVIAEGEASAEAQTIAMDCEWHGDYPSEPNAWLRTIQFSHKPYFACCIVLRTQGGPLAFKPCIDRMVWHLLRLVTSTNRRRVRIAGHHFRADLPWLCHLDPELATTLVRGFAGAATPEDTASSGGFDTMLAAHAVTEAPGPGGFKLEVLALNICGMPRYDGKIQMHKTQYCRQNKIKPADLPGYGFIPDDDLHHYANSDVDATSRLVEAYNKPGGLLDSDANGNSSRVPFWISMRATLAFLEMEMSGIGIDTARGNDLTDMFIEATQDLTNSLRDTLHWPEFNPKSSPHCCNLLFGDSLSGRINKVTGERVRVAPSDAVTFNLQPVKTTGKPARDWSWVVSLGQTDLYSPSTDKETLGILITKCMETQPEVAEVVKTLRYCRFASQVLTSVLRRPRVNVEALDDDSSERVYEKGLLSFVHQDGRVRTHFFQTMETGRASSSRPPIQAISKSRERDYAAILGKKYRWPIRSIIRAAPGYAIVEADYQGAELFMMAVQSGDQLMIEHCRRGVLKEDHPDHYDIHANIAVDAFQLTVKTRELSEKLRVPLGAPLPATKRALKISGEESLRTAAKAIIFGRAYGRGEAAVVRAIEQEGSFITMEQAEKLSSSIFTKYSWLPVFFEKCKMRVTSPGWMCNCFGRYRRFQLTGCDDGGEMERQAMNFCIQSGVADAVSRALDYLYEHPDRYDERGDSRYRIIMQLHDAIICEVRISDLERFVGTEEEFGIIDDCMTRKVPIWSCDLDGKRTSSAPYFMGAETSVMLNWGMKIDPEEGQALGIPSRFYS